MTILSRHLRAAILAGAFIAGPAWADHGHLDHAKLGGSQATTKRMLKDATGGLIDVEWVAQTIDAQAKDIVYTLTLKRDPNSADSRKPLSLYNLRLQGRAWTVEVIDVVAGNIAFLDGGGQPLKDASGAVNPRPEIPAAADQGQDNVNPDRVCFLQFADATATTCVLKVKSNRKIHGNVTKPDKMKMLAEHETMPPPPEPGGDEGSSK